MVADEANPKQARAPRTALEEMQRSQVSRRAEQRTAVQKAMLIACGERGYRKATVRDVLERSGCSRVRFYQLFEGKADCYREAYETEIAGLCERLLGSAESADGWHAGIRAALVELRALIRDQPQLAKGLLVEVHAAGEPALARRREVIERLTRAVDGARRETESRHSPPPITAEFIVCAIEQAVLAALAKGEPERFAEQMPELVFLAVALYFGSESGREERAALGSD